MMNCPEDVRGALLEILTHGLLRIRVSGWNGQADRCAVEADHLHNIPGILRDFNIGELTYYWDATRVWFMAESSDVGFAEMEEPWLRIDEYLSSVSGNRR